MGCHLDQVQVVDRVEDLVEDLVEDQAKDLAEDLAEDQAKDQVEDQHQVLQIHQICNLLLHCQSFYRHTFCSHREL